MSDVQIILEELEELSGRCRALSVAYPPLTANFLSYSNRVNDFLGKPTDLKLQKVIEDLYIIEVMAKKLLEEEYSKKSSGTMDGQLVDMVEPIAHLATGLLAPDG